MTPSPQASSNNNNDTISTATAQAASPIVVRNIRWLHPSLRRDWRFFVWANTISAFSGSSATFGIVVLWEFTKYQTPIRGQMINSLAPLSLGIFSVFCILQWSLARRMFNRHICAHIPRSLFRANVHAVVLDVEARKDALRRITRWNWYLPAIGILAHVVWAFAIRLLWSEYEINAWMDTEGIWIIVAIGVGLNVIYAIRLQSFDPVPLLSLHDSTGDSSKDNSIRRELFERTLREDLYRIRSGTLIYKTLETASRFTSSVFTGIFASMSTVVESAQAFNKRSVDSQWGSPKIKSINIQISPYDAYSLMQSTFVVIVAAFIAWNFPAERYVEGRIVLIVLLGLSVLSISFIDLFLAFLRAIPRPDTDEEHVIAATFGATSNEALTDRFLVRLGRIDPSVDLWRRWVLEQKLIEKLDLSEKTEGPPQIAVAMFDIDDFGSVNKKYSHDHGDELLRGVATCIFNNLGRRTDMCARWGGEEFVMVFLGTGGEYAKNAAETVRKDVSSEVWLEKVEQKICVRIPGRAAASERSTGQGSFKEPSKNDVIERRITISAGVASTGEFTFGRVPSFNELIGLADARMRHAKQVKGKNCVADAHDFTFDEAIEAGIIKDSWSRGSRG